MVKYLLLFSLLPLYLLANTQSHQSLIIQKIRKDIFHQDSLKNEVMIDSQKIQIDYTFSSLWENFLKKILKKTHSEFASIVVVDNNTGEIKAMVGRDGEKQKFSKRLCLENTSPAASIIKVVTAADLINHAEIPSEKKFYYRGKRTTLYKKQVFDYKNRGRKVSFIDAFKNSNNVVFGKASVLFSNPKRLHDMARTFYFNKKVLPLFSSQSEISLFPKTTDPYVLSQLASGLNRLTLISPVHAAKIIQIIANDGLDIPLSLIKSVYYTGRNKKIKIYDNKQMVSKSINVLGHKPIVELKKMLRKVVYSGTARSIHRTLPEKIKTSLDVGGKTGSMSGGFPYGRRDWFVFYVDPKDKQDKGISVAIMFVNRRHWSVQSTKYARKIIQFYYQNFISPYTVISMLK